MARVIHGDTGGNQLNVSADKTQVYGLSGNDTIISDNKQDALLIGGSGNDSLIMAGGTGTLNGGAGADTFELTYSATKSLSAVIEDFVPTEDKIVVNHDGDTAPQLISEVKGNDVVLKDDSGLLNVTLKGVRENDYFDGTASNEVWQVLRLTNEEREAQGLSALTLSEGLMQGASIRAEEITDKGKLGLLTDHTRLDDKTSWLTVFDEIGKQYTDVGENLDGGARTAEEVVKTDWMTSDAHRENILKESYQKIGIGYKEDDPDPTHLRFYWTQWFAKSLSSSEKATVSTANLLTANIQTNAVTKTVTATDDANTLANADYSATIDALGGNDSIQNIGLNASVSGGAGKDTIDNSGSFTTINAGLGDDSISLADNSKEVLIQYAKGDGNDTIRGLNSTDTVSISGDEYTPAIVGDNVIIAVGNDSITLTSVAKSGAEVHGTKSNFIIQTENDDSLENTLGNATIAALGGNDTITNCGDSVTIDGGTGDDSVRNQGNGITIDVSEGNDRVENLGDSVTIDGGSGNNTIVSDAKAVTINGGADNDSIWNGFNSSDVSINAGAGDDWIQNGFQDEGCGTNVTIESGDGNDSIISWGYMISGSVTIDAGNGDDYIYNEGVNVSINGAAGNDSIRNYGDDVTILGGDGNDSIRGSGTIYGGEGNDYIRGGDLINGGDGNDSIRGSGTIYGGDGNDSIRGSGTIYGGDGNDYISVHGGSIDAGAGNDTIYNGYWSENVTINAGSGDDLISLNSDSRLGSRYHLIQYKDGDDNDTIYGFQVDSTLIIGDGTDTYSTQLSGDSYQNIIVNVGEGSIVLLDAATLSTVNIMGVAVTSDKVINLAQDGDTYTNTVAGATIFGSTSKDTINNNSDSVAIFGNAGKDHIRNEKGGTNSTLSGGSGDDYIDNWYVNSVTMNGGDGKDYINNYDGDSVTIGGGAGNDYIGNSGDNVSIDGGVGDDTIDNWGDSVTIAGGRGNDLISLDSDSRFSKHNVIQYNSDDGYDTVYTFKGDSTLIIGDGTETYSTQLSGDNDQNIIVKVGAGSITLLDAASLSTVNIVGTEAPYNKFFTLTEDADHYDTTIEGATIQALGGNDSINNSGSNVSINAGDGNDSLINNGANVTIDGDDGNDTIESGEQIWDYELKRYRLFQVVDDVSINGGAGDDSIENWGSNVTISGGAGDDSISNYGSNVTVLGGDGNDSVYLYEGESIKVLCGNGNDSVNLEGNDITIDGGDGDDSIDFFSNDERSSILGGAGDDTIFACSNSTVYGGDDNDFIIYSGLYSIVDGGDGNDTINASANSTVYGGNGDDSIRCLSVNLAIINGGAGNDSISNNGTQVKIYGGEGNDYIDNLTNLVTIGGGEDNDSIYNYGDSVSINGGTGNDSIYNGFDYRSSLGAAVTIEGMNSHGKLVTIDAGAGNDYILNNDDSSEVSINGSDGNDTVRNYGDLVTISGDKGNDSIRNSGDSVSVDGGTGDDSITNSGSNVTITGGAGNDRISLESNAKNVLIQYNPDDGNDTIWGLDDNSSLRIGDGTGTYSSTVRGDDVILTVGEGKITLKDFRDKPAHVIIGESGSSGGGSDSGGDNGGGGNSSGGNDNGNGGNGNDNDNNSGTGGNSSGGTSANEGKSSDASGTNQSATGSQGNQSSNANNNGGNSQNISFEKIYAELSKVTPTPPPANQNVSSDTATPAIVSNVSQNVAGTAYGGSVFDALTSATPVTSSNPNFYAGGNQIIADYQSGQKIMLGTLPTGYAFGGDNFALASETGTLLIHNVKDKVIEFTDGAGNDFLKAYSATNAGLIDGRGLAGFEVINGSDAGSDLIFAGDNGSSLWGGADNVADTLVGGNGVDIFVGGKNQGADTFLNASANDVVFLSDSTLSDVVATAGTDNAVAVAFNTGNVVMVGSSEPLSAAFMLADGSAYRYNHVTKSWQTA